jgi:hypothetical protein
VYEVLLVVYQYCCSVAPSISEPSGIGPHLFLSALDQPNFSSKLSHSPHQDFVYQAQALASLATAAVALLGSRSPIFCFLALSYSRSPSSTSIHPAASGRRACHLSSLQGALESAPAKPEMRTVIAGSYAHHTQVGRVSWPFVVAGAAGQSC